MQIGDVSFEALIDRTRLDLEIKKIQRDYANLQIAFTTLKPTVDHTPLVRLNQHLEKKKQHHKEIQRYFENNPLTIRSQLLGSEQVNAQIEEIENKLEKAKISFSQPFTLTVEVDDARLTDLNEHLDKKIEHYKEVQEVFAKPISVVFEEKNRKESTVSKIESKRTYSDGESRKQKGFPLNQLSIDDSNLIRLILASLNEIQRTVRNGIIILKRAVTESIKKQSHRSQQSGAESSSVSIYSPKPNVSLPLDSVETRIDKLINSIEKSNKKTAPSFVGNTIGAFGLPIKAAISTFKSITVPLIYGVFNNLSNSFITGLNTAFSGKYGTIENIARQIGTKFAKDLIGTTASVSHILNDLNKLSNVLGKQRLQKIDDELKSLSGRATAKNIKILAPQINALKREKAQIELLMEVAEGTAKTVANAVKTRTDKDSVESGKSFKVKESRLQKERSKDVEEGDFLEFQERAAELENRKSRVRKNKNVVSQGKEVDKDLAQQRAIVLEEYLISQLKLLKVKKASLPSVSGVNEYRATMFSGSIKDADFAKTKQEISAIQEKYGVENYGKIVGVARQSEAIDAQIRSVENTLNAFKSAKQKQTEITNKTVEEINTLEAKKSAVEAKKLEHKQRVPALLDSADRASIKLKEYKDLRAFQISQGKDTAKTDAMIAGLEPLVKKTKDDLRTVTQLLKTLENQKQAFEAAIAKLKKNLPKNYSTNQPLPLLQNPLPELQNIDRATLKPDKTGQPSQMDPFPDNTQVSQQGCPVLSNISLGELNAVESRETPLPKTKSKEDDDFLSGTSYDLSGIDNFDWDAYAMGDISGLEKLNLPDKQTGQKDATAQFDPAEVAKLEVQVKKLAQQLAALDNQIQKNVDSVAEASGTARSDQAAIALEEKLLRLKQQELIARVNLQQHLKAAALAAGIKDTESLPTLQRLPEGTEYSGQYDSLNNVISLAPALYDSIASGKATQKALTTLIHELVHFNDNGDNQAQRYINRIQDTTKPGVERVEITHDMLEEKYLGSQLSLEEFTQLYEQRGDSQATIDIEEQTEAKARVAASTMFNQKESAFYSKAQSTNSTSVQLLDPKLLASLSKLVETIDITSNRMLVLGQVGLKLIEKFNKISPESATQNKTDPPVIKQQQESVKLETPSLETRLAIVPDPQKNNEIEDYYSKIKDAVKTYKAQLKNKKDAGEASAYHKTVTSMVNRLLAELESVRSQIDPALYQKVKAQLSKASKDLDRDLARVKLEIKKYNNLKNSPGFEKIQYSLDSGGKNNVSDVSKNNEKFENFESEDWDSSYFQALIQSYQKLLAELNSRVEDDREKLAEEIKEIQELIEYTKNLSKDVPLDDPLFRQNIQEPVESSYLGTGDPTLLSESLSDEDKSLIQSARSKILAADEALNNFESHLSQTNIFGTIFGGFKQGIGAIIKEISRYHQILKQHPNYEAVMGLTKLGLVAAGFGLIAYSMRNTIKESVLLAAQADRLDRQIDALSPGSIDKINESISNLGLGILEAKRLYTSFLASLQGTPLASSGEKIFTQFLGVSQNMGLDTYKRQLAAQAVSQMASKGVVSLEELRGQLAESMPGAIPAAAAAMGYLEPSQLFDKIRTGRLESSTFIPRFTSSLDIKSAVTDMSGTALSLTKIESSLQNIQVSFGNIFLPLADILTNATDKVLGFVAALTKQLSATAPATAAVGSLSAAFILLKASMTFGVSTNGLLWHIAYVSGKLLPIISSLIAQMGVFAAATIAVNEVWNIFTKITNTSGDETIKKLDKINAKLKEQGLLLKENNNKETNDDNANLGASSGSWTDSFIRFLNEPITNPFNPKQEVWSGDPITNKLLSVNRAALDELYGKNAPKNNRLLTSVETDTINETASSSELFNVVSEQIHQITSAISKEVPGLVELEKSVVSKRGQLEGTSDRVNRYNLYSAPGGYSDLSAQLSEKQGIVTGGVAAIAEIVEQLKENKQSYIDKAAGNQTLDTDLVQRQLKKFDREIEAAIQAYNKAAKQVNQFADGIELAARTIKRTNFATNRYLTNADRQLKDDTAGLIGSNILGLGDFQIQSSQLALNNESLKYNKISEHMNYLANQLAMPDIEQALRDLNVDLDAGNERVQDLLKDQDISDQHRLALQTLSDFYTYQEQAAQIGLEQAQAIQTVAKNQYDRLKSLQQISKSLYSLGNTKLDFAATTEREKTDFQVSLESTRISFNRRIRSLAESYQDLTKTLEKTLLQKEITLQEEKSRLANTEFRLGLRTALNGRESLSKTLAESLASINEAIGNYQKDQLTIDQQRLEAEQETLNISRQIRGLQEEAEEIDRDRLSQLTSLARSQEDFMTNQVRQWNEIIMQTYEIQQQALEIGTTVDNIDAEIAKQGNNLVNSLYELAQRLNESISSIPIVEGGMASTNYAVGFNTNGGNAIAQAALRVKETFVAMREGCATFVSEVLKAAGVTNVYSAGVEELDRQLAKAGAQKITNLEEIRPGDILIYKGTYAGHRGDASDNELTHAGVYSQDGQQIHHPSKSRGVIVSPVLTDNFVHAYRLPMAQGNRQQSVMPQQSTTSLNVKDGITWQEGFDHIKNLLGAEPLQILKVIHKESTFNPKAIGGEGNNFRGLIQWGINERDTELPAIVKKLGLDIRSGVGKVDPIKYTAPEQLLMAAEWIKKRGYEEIKPGVNRMSALGISDLRSAQNIYKLINPGLPFDNKPIRTHEAKKFLENLNSLISSVESQTNSSSNNVITTTKPATTQLVVPNSVRSGEMNVQNTSTKPTNIVLDAISQKLVEHALNFPKLTPYRAKVTDLEQFNTDEVGLDVVPQIDTDKLMEQMRAIEDLDLAIFDIRGQAERTEAIQQIAEAIDRLKIASEDYANTRLDLQNTILNTKFDTQVRKFGLKGFITSEEEFDRKDIEAINKAEVSINDVQKQINQTTYDLNQEETALKENLREILELETKMAQQGFLSDLDSELLSESQLMLAAIEDKIKLSKEYLEILKQQLGISKQELKVAEEGVTTKRDRAAHQLTLNENSRNMQIDRLTKLSSLADPITKAYYEQSKALLEIEGKYEKLIHDAKLFNENNNLGSEALQKSLAHLERMKQIEIKTAFQEAIPFINNIKGLFKDLFTSGEGILDILGNFLKGIADIAAEWAANEIVGYIFTGSSPTQDRKRLEKESSNDPLFGATEQFTEIVFTANDAIAQLTNTVGGGGGLLAAFSLFQNALSNFSLFSLGQGLPTIPFNPVGGLIESATSIFSGGLSGGFTGDSIVSSALDAIPRFAEGGAVDSTIKMIPVFKEGGEVEIENFKSGGDVLGLGMGVMAAMQKEGAGAVPIVAHRGEYVLSDRTGDAQFYKQLKMAGDWERLKSEYRNQKAEVRNYNFGGEVGSTGSFATAPSRATQSQTYHNYTTNINVVTPDSNSFRRTRSQIAAKERLEQERQARRNY